jgi:hypothetical protein
MRKGIYGGAFIRKMEEAVRLGGISHPNYNLSLD